MPEAPKSALITGGAGFIGSHLAELLLEGGWSVWALDDLSTGSYENVAHLRDHDRFHLVVDTMLSRSEEHTSELQSHVNLVCRLLLEKKKKKNNNHNNPQI